ncbi:ThuA domain-containing protein, partial [bacterium]|nr:ThuA domain-containing protein [bacterium]
MRRFWTVALVLACSVAALAGTAEDLAKFVPEADMIKILAAIPDAATAKPAATRKLLILTESAEDLAKAEKNAGMKFVPHPSAPHCALAIAEMGKKTGAFAATIATDPKIITADGLAPFDAVVLANVYLGGKLYLIPRDFTTEPKPAFQAQQKALLDFVKNGKGIVGIHNTTAEALGWPEYNTMIGAVHSGIAWYANQATPIK